MYISNIDIEFDRLLVSDCSEHYEGIFDPMNRYLILNFTSIQVSNDSDQKPTTQDTQYNNIIQIG